MADYYARQVDKADPFNWIQIHPLLNAEAISQFPFDHAGEGETSLMLSLCPQAVDMRRFRDKTWYTAGARQASKKLGDKGRDLILAEMRRILAPKPGQKPAADMGGRHR